ncbi:MAG TPA: M1 family aminopeptidase [Bacteroidota bacterium]|nr:M1 family aminopeptidase [Bacteroidota bacterium]
MKRTIFALSIFCLSGATLHSQHLPGGTYRPNRERSYDILHYKADLTIDWSKKQIIGAATIRLHPLATASSIELDAYWLKISEAKDLRSGKSLRFSSTDMVLNIELGRTLQPTDTISIMIGYTAQPTAGLYFVDEGPNTGNRPAIFTYGEGGIHANWLPIYNENNDKFSTEMFVTVEKPHTAISNGKLLETKENANGTRTFHWYQSLPHSNYLIALFVGDYVSVPLRPAFGSIPLSVWVHAGQEDQARSVFARTPEMVEFYSRRFNFRYPWDKYDQISAFDYAIGAMENTTITGHNDKILRKPDQLEEFNPDFENYNANFTAEAIISHELGHHWFGDNTTCRTLANLWMNESFASYMMMLWDEHRLGRDYLQSQTQFALQAYLSYVARSHIIRPLEYRSFDSRDEIYNTETTYQKGAIVLHMLRRVLGDQEFFKGLGYFQNKYQFSSVESSDLLTAFEESTGKNLTWFFDQWIWGGGHPVFEVHSAYVPARKKLEVKVEQVQPLVEGQGVFTLPVEIRIDSKGTTHKHEVWIEGQSEHFVFDVDSAPDMVSFDGRGDLVADIRFEKTPKELAYQLNNDELPGRMAALRQLTSRYPSNPLTLNAIRSLLASGAHWTLKAEATMLLRNLHSNDAVSLLLSQLSSKDYHERKASVIALGSLFTEAARKALRTTVDSEKIDDVSATALVSLAKIDPTLSPEYLRSQLQRNSWYDVKRLAALKAIEVLAAEHSVDQPERFVPLARDYVNTKYNFELRRQALKSWAACAPTDGQLINKLISTVKNDILAVQTTAMELLGVLKDARAIPVLEEAARRSGDIDVRKAARDALEEVRKVE